MDGMQGEGGASWWHERDTSQRRLEIELSELRKTLLMDGEMRGDGMGPGADVVDMRALAGLEPDSNVVMWAAPAGQVLHHWSAAMEGPRGSPFEGGVFVHVLGRLLMPFHSNDPLARALTLHAVAALADCVCDHAETQHAVLRCLAEASTTEERLAAARAADALCSRTASFCRLALPRVSTILHSNSNSTNVEPEGLAHLVMLLRHMHRAHDCIAPARQLCHQLLASPHTAPHALRCLTALALHSLSRDEVHAVADMLYTNITAHGPGQGMDKDNANAMDSQHGHVVAVSLACLARLVGEAGHLLDLWRATPVSAALQHAARTAHSSDAVVIEHAAAILRLAYQFAKASNGTHPPRELVQPCLGAPNVAGVWALRLWTRLHARCTPEEAVAFIATIVNQKQQQQHHHHHQGRDGDGDAGAVAVVVPAAHIREWDRWFARALHVVLDAATTSSDVDAAAAALLRVLNLALGMVLKEARPATYLISQLVRWVHSWPQAVHTANAAAATATIASALHQAVTSLSSSSSSSSSEFESFVLELVQLVLVAGVDAGSDRGGRAAHVAALLGGTLVEALSPHGHYQVAKMCMIWDAPRVSVAYLSRLPVLSHRSMEAWRVALQAIARVLHVQQQQAPQAASPPAASAPPHPSMDVVDVDVDKVDVVALLQEARLHLQAADAASGTHVGVSFAFPYFFVHAWREFSTLVATLPLRYGHVVHCDVDEHGLSLAARQLYAWGSRVRMWAVSFWSQFQPFAASTPRLSTARVAHIHSVGIALFEGVGAVVQAWASQANATEEKATKTTKEDNTPTPNKQQQQQHGGAKHIRHLVDVALLADPHAYDAHVDALAAAARAAAACIQPPPSFFVCTTRM